MVRLFAARLRRTAGSTLLLFLALAAFGNSPAAAAQKVVLQLSGPAQFRFAGYYAALWQGFYRQAGLEVRIVPKNPAGKNGPTDPVREVVEGRAQFGIGGSELLVRASQGLPLLLLAPVFQESAARVYYRADTDFSSPVALWNATVGRLPASSFLDVQFRTALAAEGIDADKLRARAVPPGETLKELQEKQIDAAIASAWKLPWQAREQGIALKSFDPADYRVAYYGDSLFTVIHYATAHPGITARFRAASLKGWAYALSHAQAVAIHLAQSVAAPSGQPQGASDPLGFALYEAALAQKLSGYPGTPLGHANRQRWVRIAQNLKAAGVLLRPVDLSSFLYEGASAAPGASPIGLLILGLALALLVAAAIFLAWRRFPERIPGLPRALQERWREPAQGRRAAAIVSELSEIAESVATAFDRLLLEPATAGAPSEKGPDPKPAALRESARQAVERLLAVTRRLAAHAQPARAATRPTDLNTALSELAAAVRQKLPAGVSFRLSLLPEAPLCESDADAVSAAVLDLAEAAVAEMRAGGELVLGTRHAEVDAARAKEWPESALGAYVRLTVRDSGSGFPLERLEQMLDSAKTPRPSVAAAAAMVRRQGGFVRVESAEEVGTAVHLYFKRSEEAAARTASEPAKAAE